MKLSKLQKKLSSSEPYAPAEDTFLLEDYIKNERGNCALDIGSGSGYLTRSLQKSFTLVIGTDISFSVLKNQTYKTKNKVCCHAADSLNLEFDLIICNLPYIPTDEIIDVATDGGRDGLEITLPIIRSAIPRLKKGGKFLFVTSSLSKFSRLIEEAKKMGAKTKILATKKLFFEELYLIQAIR